MKQKPLGNFSVYLDDCLAESYVFKEATAVITATEPSEIQSAFEQIRHFLKAGYYVAGWISYETGLYLEGKLTKLAHNSYDVPFLCFGIYKERHRLSVADSDDHWAACVNDRHDVQAYVENVRLNISQEDYENTVEKIHDYLTAGDIYQVNYTLKAKFDFSGRTESYFAAMRKAQKVEYGAYITSDDLSVLSLSPELFFKKVGRNITVRPMKGTCPRGRTASEDQEKMTYLKNDEKNRAENLMIVDLLRNDLAKIAVPGSVKLKSLYDVEKYRTLFQMTSTVTAEVPDDRDVIDLIKALFPCGSVTGAPKMRAMEIISELEPSPRGIYTGAIGYIAPDGDCCFSVPIRTVTIDKFGQGEMGIGSAIIADSDGAAEYEECLLKARFATKAYKEFALLESLRWSEEAGYQLLDLHIARLKSSSTYFDFIFDEAAILNDLCGHSAYLDPSREWKVRLLLSQKGHVSITSLPIKPRDHHEMRIITLSDTPIDSQNPLLCHKTTDREFYDHTLRDHQKKYGSYDVIFLNERGHITEGTYHNIFLKQGDILYTPPGTSGLLKGVLRQSLMDDLSCMILEKDVTPADLIQSDEIYMGNSVRGLVAVTYRET